MKDIKNYVSHLFDLLAVELGASDNVNEKAMLRYESVRSWLCRDASTLAEYSPAIYLQGSFELGTVTKPVEREDDYDIDIVCELPFSTSNITQKQLKSMLGHEIKAYVQANNLQSPTKEGRRCWTLHYADSAQFHIDILPAISSAHSTYDAQIIFGNIIHITDNTSDSYNRLCPYWFTSNPRGYVSWFNQQSNTSSNGLLKLKEITSSKRANFKTKNTLQKVIQILKRHRDVMFSEDLENKPISMIITTLAAHAYDGEEDIFDALKSIIHKMTSYIQFNNNGVLIRNPVNPSENFADKWTRDPRKKQMFDSWFEQLKIDILSISFISDIEGVINFFKLKFGERATSDAAKKLLNKITISSSADTNQALRLFDETYRQKPLWQIYEQGNISLTGRISYNSQSCKFDSNGTSLPKNSNLYFRAETDIPPPFNVYWQVVNTGDEAKNAKQLRGNIFLAASAGAGGLSQKEKTAYKGSHYVQCYIVKNNICVARSKEFIVNVS